MKALAKLLALLVGLFFVSGCYSAKVFAPYDSQITLADNTTPLAFKQTKRNFYVLWGLIPLSDDSTHDIIRDNGLKKVRVTNEVTVVDFFISLIVSPLSITTSTTLVEGSR